MSAEPRVLADYELTDFEQTERCQKSWWARSLLLTIGHHRELAADNEQLLRVEIGSQKASLKWFEETYNTRPLAPLFAPKHEGQACPHCKKRGAAHVGLEWCCLECGKLWSLATPIPAHKGKA